MAGTAAGPFRLTGEIDLAVVPDVEEQLRAWLHESDAPEAVIDCSDLTFIDSSGVGMLFRLAQSLGDRRRALVLEHVPRVARRVFDVVGLEREIEVRGPAG